MLAGVGWTSWLWLPRLRLPVLILMGADDPIVPAVNGRIIADRLPDARLEMVACGHLFILTDPAGTAARIERFIAGDGDRPASPGLPWQAPPQPDPEDKPMAAYTAPVDDVAFLLGKVFDFDRRMAELPGCEEVNTELAVSVLEEAGKFASEVLEPLNRPGDEEGCRLVDGEVVDPQGHGRSLPRLRRGRLDAASPAIRSTAARACRGCCSSCSTSSCARPTCRSACSPASAAAPSRRSSTTPAPELKAAYLPKMISGEWTGRDGADRGLGRHRPRPARHPRRPERRRQLRHHRHQDLHLLRRPRLRRQRRPPRPRPPARRAEGRAAASACSSARSSCPGRTAASAPATPCRSARSSTRWASTPSPPA